MSEQNDKSVENKLGELMLQGWTMLADHCFMESCHTPLMRDNVTKQIYCVGCEAWVINKDKRKHEQKYNELVSLEGKRNIILKNNNEVSIPKQSSFSGPSSFKSFRDCLETKMLEFSSWLQNEHDISKCNSILDAMKKTLEMLKDLKENQ